MRTNLSEPAVEAPPPLFLSRIQYLLLSSVVLWSASVALAADRQAQNTAIKSALWVVAAKEQNRGQQNPTDNYKASLILGYLESVFYPQISRSELKSHTQLAIAVTELNLPDNPADISKWSTAIVAKVPPKKIEVWAPPLLALASATSGIAMASQSAGEQDPNRSYVEGTNVFAEAYRLAALYPDTFGKIVNQDLQPRFLKLSTNAQIVSIVQQYPNILRGFPQVRISRRVDP